MSKNTTIKDIARLSGYSVTTVSRALNNHPDINEETKKKIMDVVKETGFVPNTAAINLKKRKANNIALLVKGMTNPFLNRMISVLEEALQLKDYTVILRHVEAKDDEVKIAIRLSVEHRLKGIVFLGGNFSHEEALIDKLKMPLVFSTVGGRDGEKNKYSNICVDDVGESEKMVSYLISLGHKDIAFIGDNISTTSVGMLRYEGYCNALKKAGISVDPFLTLEAEGENERFTYGNGYKLTKRLLDSKHHFTAIFCTADVFAVGASRALLDAGLTIPGDVSVAGYDGIPLGEYFIPRITTIRQPVEKMADETAKLLFNMMEKKEKPKSVLMPGELIVRESTGKCKE